MPLPASFRNQGRTKRPTDPVDSIESLVDGVFDQHQTKSKERAGKRSCVPSGQDRLALGEHEQIGERRDAEKEAEPVHKVKTRPQQDAAANNADGHQPACFRGKEQQSQYRAYLQQRYNPRPPILNHEDEEAAVNQTGAKRSRKREDKPERLHEDLKVSVWPGEMPRGPLQVSGRVKRLLVVYRDRPSGFIRFDYSKLSRRIASV